MAIACRSWADVNREKIEAFMPDIWRFILKDMPAGGGHVTRVYKGFEGGTPFFNQDCRGPGRGPGRSPGRSPGRGPGRGPGRSPGRRPGRRPGRGPGASGAVGAPK